MHVRVFSGTGLPGTRQARRAHFETVRQLIRGQPGFLSFEMMEDGDEWLVIARWSSRAEADAWGASPIFREQVAEALRPLLREPASVKTYKVTVPDSH